MRLPNSRNTGSKSRAARTRSTIESLERRQLLSTVVVNTTADSTDAKGSSTVSLRDAIAVANAATTATTITFSPTVFATAKTITLGGTAMIISNAKAATTITGPTAGLTINGNKKSQAFVVENGAVANLSTLTITNCAITVPNPLTTSPSGGAILIALSGTLNLSNCALTNNSAAQFGGALDGNFGTIDLVNDTFAGNTAGYEGGAVSGAGTEVIKDCTIFGNDAKVSGGGVYGTGTITTLANSIIAGNSAGTSGPDLFGYQDASFHSLGHNLIGKTDGSTGWTSADYTGTVAKPLNADLGSLASNGGPTQTLLPLTGSPAIDKGSNSLIPSGTTTDQRGLPRTYNGTVDIGAVEVQPLVQIKAPGSQTATLGVSKSVTLGSFTQFTNDAPFKALITWGDGSASTTLSLTAAGTIPATAHVFAKSGTITVTEVITDAKGNKSNTVTFTETVTAALGSIAGTVFDDANGDGKIDNGEFGVGLWTVYLDLNKDGKLDTGDKSVTTDINGNFSFTGLAAGTYVVRVVPVTGITATKPTGGVATITLTAGQNSVGNVFGEKA